MEEVLRNLVGSFAPQIVALASGVVAAALSYGVKKLRDYVDAKISHDHVNEALMTTVNVIVSAVKAAGREVRPDLKKALRDGDLSDDEIDSIKEKAVAKAKTEIGNDVMDNLDGVIDDVEGYIEDKIEEVLFDLQE